MNTFSQSHSLGDSSSTDANGESGNRRKKADKLTFSVEEAAEFLGIGRSLAYQAVRTNTFPTTVIKVGNRYIIPRAPLEALLGLGVGQSGHPGEFESCDVGDETL